PYGRKHPPYSAKNGPFDSLDELRLIEGWDEDMHTIFSPYITVYPFHLANDNSAVNINTANKALLGCLLPEAKVECNEKFQQTINTRNIDGTNLAASEQSLKQVLSDVFCYQGSSN